MAQLLVNYTPRASLLGAGGGLIRAHLGLREGGVLTRKLNGRLLVVRGEKIAHTTAMFHC